MIKLMIVEDEDILRTGMVELIDFASLGYELVAECSDGKEAFESFEQTKPDVILTDICMDEMSGLEFVAALGEKAADTKVIILSGHSDFTYMKESIRLKAVDYVLKPVSLAEISQLLKELAEKINKDCTEPSEEKKYSPTVAQALEYINNNLSDFNLNIHSVSKEVNFSVSYFSAIFKKETGQSFVKYINDKRVEYACELLRTTRKQVSEIASMVGIIDVRYFCIVFKNVTGETPRVYRQKRGS